MTRIDTTSRSTETPSLPPAILELVRDGRRARGFRGRRAERDVCYGDYLQVLVDEARAASAERTT